MEGAELFFSSENLSSNLKSEQTATVLMGRCLSLAPLFNIYRTEFASSSFESICYVNDNHISASKVIAAILSS